jgi:hypothetical protein
VMDEAVQGCPLSRVARPVFSIIFATVVRQA